MIGQTISHYKIVSKLGEGGMGVVYKAEDLRLKRIVALKFLPRGLDAQEPERARFLQEAQAASALNHSNICTIHDLQEYEGPHGDKQQFIVMEYIDGRTLRQVIPIAKSQDAITYAIQIGEALHEAHGHGIVHRDVKPENIMVNTKSQIKVMDFGLAKLKGSLKLTRTSSTVGTLAYMAPEQIEGGEVDARGDIFSFGIVLYEMLTGNLPFRGEHEAAMMYSIINEEPESLLKFRPDLPADLDRIVHRALEKDPEDRYQSVADMVSELRKTLKQSTRVVHSGTGRMAAPPGREGTSAGKGPVMRRGVLLPVIGIAALLLVLAVYLVFFRTRAVEVNPDMRFQTLQISFSQISYPGLSGDGNWIAFPAADANGKWDIYYMNIAVGEPRRVTFDSSANVYGSASADISPDGGLITYNRFNTRLGWYEVYVVPSIGGRSTRIAQNGISGRWRGDGSRIGYIVTQGKDLSFWSVKPDGSDRRLEMRDSLSVQGRIAFDWSPDGGSIVWLRSFQGGYQEVIRHDLTTGRETQLTSDSKNIDEVRWMNNGQIIYSSNKSGNTNLWMVPASGGQSVQLTKGSGPDMGMSVSADSRRILYVQRQQTGYLWRCSIDGHGCRQLTSDERNITWPTLSPDGRQIAFGMSDNDPLKKVSHIYLCDRDGNNRRQITTGDEVVGSPAWSPDGKWISYHAFRSGETFDSARIYLIDAVESGSPRMVGQGLVAPWLDTAHLLIFNPVRNIGSIVGLDGTSTSITYADSVSLFPLLDGKHVLLYDTHVSRQGWYIVPARDNRVLDRAVPKKILPALLPPNLSPDKKFLYYATGNGTLRRISLPDGKDEKVAGTYPGLLILFSISRDGKEIVYNDSRLNAKLVLIDNVFK